MLWKPSLFRFGFMGLMLVAYVESSLGQEYPNCHGEQQAVSKIINSLGSKLEGLIKNESNYFFSPLSISLALAMVYIGARGTTKDQMAKALEFNVIGKNCLPNKLSENFRTLIRSLEKEDEYYSLLIANGGFVKNGYKITQSYTSNLKTFFKSNIMYLNFAEEEIATMEKINEWVETYTRGRISKLLNEPLNPLTVLVIINAVYFKGQWDVPFDKEATTDSLFFLANGWSKVTKFMVMEDRFDFYKDEQMGYSFLELDYKGGNISMILALPNTKTENPQLTLTNELLCSIRTKFELKTVRVILPKFNMEYKRELSKDMVKLGMVELFSDTADLTGIREQRDLHVSVMVHKAVIEVNEEGTEAAAISGIGIDGRQKVSEKVIFQADHPFLFYIVHKNTDTILFAGRLSNP